MANKVTIKCLKKLRFTNKRNYLLKQWRSWNVTRVRSYPSVLRSVGHFGKNCRTLQNNKTVSSIFPTILDILSDRSFT